MTTIKFSVWADPLDIHSRAAARAREAFGQPDPDRLTVDIGSGRAMHLTDGTVVGWEWRVEATLADPLPANEAGEAWEFTVARREDAVGACNTLIERIRVRRSEGSFWLPTIKGVG